MVFDQSLVLLDNMIENSWRHVPTHIPAGRCYKIGHGIVINYGWQICNTKYINTKLFIPSWGLIKYACPHPVMSYQLLTISLSSMI